MTALMQEVNENLQPQTQVHFTAEVIIWRFVWEFIISAETDIS